MTLIEVLKIMYPNANFLRDIIVQDEGQGQYIAQWHLEDEQPSADQISAWMKNAEINQQHIFNLNKITNQPIYVQLEEIDRKTIRAFRTQDGSRIDALEAQAVELRKQLLPTS